jgi:hypothetical protein
MGMNSAPKPRPTMAMLICDMAGLDMDFEVEVAARLVEH